MAWRPNEYIKEGVLSFFEDGTVKGITEFAGLRRAVKFDLTNAPQFLRGKTLTFKSTGFGASQRAQDKEARTYMRGFSPLQKGKIDYVDLGGWAENSVTIAWYGENNGRVCCEFFADYALVDQKES